MRIRTLDAKGADDQLIARIIAADDRVDWPTVPWFQSKYFGSPAGESIIALAEEDDHIAGIVAFGRIGLQVLGERIEGALSYETFVSPHFRKRGLFLSLLEHATTEASRRGVRLLFNFPNPASLPGFLRSGWRQARGLQNWIRPQHPIRTALGIARRRDQSQMVPAEASPPQIAPADLGPFEAGPAEAAAIRPDLDRHFLSWRYGAQWNIDYHSVGADSLPMLVRTGTRWGLREVQIMELARDRPLRRHDLSAALREIRQRWRPSLIGISLSEAHPASASLRRHGFLRAPTHSNFCYLPLDDSLAAKTVNTPWHLTNTLVHMN